MPISLSRRGFARSTSPLRSPAALALAALFLAAQSACSLLAPSDEELFGSSGTGGAAGGAGMSPTGASGTGGSGVIGGVAGVGGSGGAGGSTAEGPLSMLPLAGTGGSAASEETDQPLPAPPDAGVPPAEPPLCIDCESIRITGGVETLGLGSPGGSLNIDICPRDQVVVGMDYTYGFASPADFGFLTSVALVCGELAPSRSAGTVQVITGEPLLPRGAGTAQDGTGGRCPPGQVVAGFEGVRNFDGVTSELREVTLHCSPLALAQDASVAIGAARPAPPLSAEFAVSTVLPTDVLPLQLCPQGQVARGAVVRAGSWVDGIGFICGTPVLALPDGQPCSSALECQSGSCSGTCQPRTCTAPAGCTCELRETTQFAFCDAAQTQSEAAAICAAAGMHLANAFDPITHGWLRSSAGKAGIQAAFWLGADDLLNEGVWQWAAAAGAVDLASELWDRNEVRNGAGENCMQMTRDGHWDDVLCTLAQPFACEAPVP